MWLYAPQEPGEPEPPSSVLCPPFEFWTLIGGKPTAQMSSDVDWAKAPWASALHLWESDARKESRVRRFIDSIGRAGSPRVVSLCSGYGGLDLGIQTVLPNARTVCHVERQGYAAAVLAHRMATMDIDHAPIWSDLTTFDGAAWRENTDIVCAGIPCPSFSVAGKRKGTDDVRWLWPEVWRITQATQARWLLIENVPGILSAQGGTAIEIILGDLASRGFHAEWDCLPAGTVGAPHIRDRFWLLATDANRVSVRVEPERDQRGGRRERATERGNAELVRASSGGRASDSGSSGPQGKRSRRAATDRDLSRGAVALDGLRDWPEVSTDATPHASGGRCVGEDCELPAREPDASGCGAPNAASVERSPGGRSDEHEERTHVERVGGRTPNSDRIERTPWSAKRGTRQRRGPESRGGGDAASDEAITTDADNARLPSNRRSGKLDRREWAQRWRDADGCGGPWSRRTIALVGRILDEGATYWDWGRAPLSAFRSLDDGASNWLDGDLNAEDVPFEGTSTPVLPSMQRAAGAQAIRWRATGGQRAFCFAENLQSEVHGGVDDGAEPEPDSGRVSASRPEVSEGEMRELSDYGGSVDPSQESNLERQPPGEFGDALRELSHHLASRGWRDFEAQDASAVSVLLATLKKTRSLRCSLFEAEEVWRSMPDARKHRWLVEASDRCERAFLSRNWAEQIHLIGNGVVPACAALALALLWERLHGTAIDDDDALATGAG